MKRFIRVCALLLIVCLFCSNFTFALERNDKEGKEICFELVKVAKVNGVDPYGSNMNNAYKDENSIISAKNKIEKAVIDEGKIYIKGAAFDTAFSISARLVGKSENGNIIVFEGKEELGNFRLVYCSIEKELVKSSLYFKNDEVVKYNNVLKIYLAPNDTDEKNYIMIEAFGNAFPSIENGILESLSADSCISMFWYTKEFEPIEYVGIEEPLIMAGNPSHTITKQYRYNHLGDVIKHTITFKEDCDIRDVMHGSSANASGTITITGKTTEAPSENDCSSTQSVLSLEKVSIIYLTRSNTAIESLIAQGTVKQNAMIVANFNIDIGIGLKGLTATPSINFTWQPGHSNWPTGTTCEIHTNTEGSYWREGEGKLKTNQSLANIGNNFKVKWGYGSYSNDTNTASAYIAFKYYVNNQLNYSQSYYDSNSWGINVNVL